MGERGAWGLKREEQRHKGLNDSSFLSFFFLFFYL